MNKDKNNSPPRLAVWILKRLLHEDISVSAVPTLAENFELHFSNHGWLRAAIWYWGQVFIFIPLIFKNAVYWNRLMLKNYIVTAIRQIKRERVNSLINIFGLSIGIAFTLLVYLFIDSENSFDEFHENADNIYRVWTILDNPDKGISYSQSTPIRLADDLVRLYPEIEQTARISDKEVIISKGTDTFRERLTYVDPQFFDIFSFPVLLGSKTNPLYGLNSLAISKEIAAKYFQDEYPIGKHLKITRNGKEEDFIVSAVIDNERDRSSIAFSIIAHYRKFTEDMSSFMLESYFAKNPVTFLMVKSNISLNDLKQKIIHIDKDINQDFEDGVTQGYRLEKLEKIHFNTSLGSNSKIRNSDPVYSYILGGLGGVVLIIACINFITLSLGMISKRFKEVGVRKVLGAQKKQLIIQFIGESVLLSAIALILGIILAVTFMPFFNEISGKNIDFILDYDLALFFIGLILFIGLFAGSYPGLVLSRFDPVKVFKGFTDTGRKNNLIKSLVLVQFSLSIFMIILTLVFQRQLKFISDKDLGFDQNKLIEINLEISNQNTEQLYERFKNEIIGSRRILNAAATSTKYGMYSNLGVFWTEIGYIDDSGEQRYFNFNQVSYDYLETLGIELLSGRNFSKEHGSDLDNAIIINESAVKYFDLRNPINSRLNKIGKNTQQIIGVIKDFHFASLYGEVKPLVLALSGNSLNMGMGYVNHLEGFWPHVYNYAVVKISEGNIQPVIRFLKERWKKVAPGTPFEIEYIDETIRECYQSEHKRRKIVNFAAILSIMIACFGLFGLSLINVQKKTKEIGLRRLLGASVGKIIGLISKDMLLLLLLANIFAWPAAYYFMSKWLDDFAFRISLHPFIFLSAGIIVFAVAAFTVSFQTIKASRTNPVDSIRNE